jgi:hypothetical protein
MSEENLMSKYLDTVNKFYSIGMKNIKIYKKVLGTNFVVNRPKMQSKYRQVFGGSYSSDDILENDYTQFNVRLIINMNDMRDVWSRNRDTLEVYNDSDELEVGDELQYTREGRTYRFKVAQKSAYSEVSTSIYVYVLSSIIETLDK